MALFRSLSLSLSNSNKGGVCSKVISLRTECTENPHPWIWNPITLLSYQSAYRRFPMKMHNIAVHYLQQSVNLNFDRTHLFHTKKESTLAFLGEKYEAGNPKPVWHISWSVWSMLGLIFSLMHPSSLGVLLQKASYFPCCSWISSVFLLFPLKTLSEWERLNSDSPQLSTHLSIHPFINLLPVCTSRGPSASLLPLQSFILF